MPGPTPENEKTETSTLLADTLDTVNSLYSEVEELRSENKNLQNMILNLHAAIGIKGGDSVEEQQRKIRVINYLRLGCLHLHGADKEWSARQRMEAIPFFIENITIEDMEGFSDAVSTMAAYVAANLKSPITIKARRLQKEKEGWDAARKAQAENVKKSPRAKAEAKAQSKEERAVDKAIAALVKGGLSEEQARTMLKARS